MYTYWKTPGGRRTGRCASAGCLSYNERGCRVPGAMIASVGAGGGRDWGEGAHRLRERERDDLDVVVHHGR